MHDPATFAETADTISRALMSQGFMRHLGAEIVAMAPGELTLGVNRRDELLQQHGFFHGGVIGFLVDNTATAAAGTIVAGAGKGVLTAEYKLNILSPATGERLICRAKVLKGGRRLIIVEAKVLSVSGLDEKLVAVGLATIAVVELAAAA